MARKKIVYADESPQFAVCVLHPDGSVGWLTGGGDRGVDVKLYPARDAAEKAISQMKKNPHYSWNLPMEVREFPGFGKKGRG